jgi:hypothetical protein
MLHCELDHHTQRSSHHIELSQLVNFQKSASDPRIHNDVLKLNIKIFETFLQRKCPAVFWSESSQHELKPICRAFVA